MPFDPNVGDRPEGFGVLRVFTTNTHVVVEHRHGTKWIRSEMTVAETRLMTKALIDAADALDPPVVPES